MSLKRGFLLIFLLIVVLLAGAVSIFTEIIRNDAEIAAAEVKATTAATESKT
jgi:cbb3-type cytochrome oxidase cytochrome c subunit